MSSRPPWDILSYLDPSAAVDADDSDGDGGTAAASCSTAAATSATASSTAATTATPDLPSPLQPLPLPFPSLADPSLAGLLAAAGSVPALVCGQSCALASLSRVGRADGADRAGGTASAGGCGRRLKVLFGGCDDTSDGGGDSDRSSTVVVADGRLGDATAAAVAQCSLHTASLRGAPLLRPPCGVAPVLPATPSVLTSASAGEVAASAGGWVARLASAAAGTSSWSHVCSAILSLEALGGGGRPVAVDWDDIGSLPFLHDCCRDDGVGVGGVGATDDGGADGRTATNADGGRRRDGPATIRVVPVTAAFPLQSGRAATAHYPARRIMLVVSRGLLRLLWVLRQTEESEPNFGGSGSGSGSGSGRSGDTSDAALDPGLALLPDLAELGAAAQQVLAEAEAAQDAPRRAGRGGEPRALVVALAGEGRGQDGAHRGGGHMWVTSREVCGGGKNDAVDSAPPQSHAEGHDETWWRWGRARRRNGGGGGSTSTTSSASGHAQPEASAHLKEEAGTVPGMCAVDALLEVCYRWTATTPATAEAARADVDTSALPGTEDSVRLADLHVAPVDGALLDQLVARRWCGTAEPTREGAAGEEAASASPLSPLCPTAAAASVPMHRAQPGASRSARNAPAAQAVPCVAPGRHRRGPLSGLRCVSVRTAGAGATRTGSCSGVHCGGGGGGGGAKERQAVWIRAEYVS